MSYPLIHYGVMKTKELEAGEQLEFDLMSDDVAESDERHAPASEVQNEMTAGSPAWWFTQIRRAIEKADERRRPVNDREIPSGKWSIYADLQRIEMI